MIITSHMFNPVYRRAGRKRFHLYFETSVNETNDASTSPDLQYLNISKYPKLSYFLQMFQEINKNFERDYEIRGIAGYGVA